jgi:hypothetical protein
LLVCSFARLLVCSFARLLVCSFARLLVCSFAERARLVNQVLELSDQNKFGRVTKTGLQNAYELVYKDSSGETATIILSAPNEKDKQFFEELKILSKEAKHKHAEGSSLVHSVSIAFGKEELGKQ